jgi:hypothetical protein
MRPPERPQHHQYTSLTGGGGGSGSFNAAGFEVTFDVTTLDAKLNQYASQAHFRITAFLLPPVTSTLPLIGSVGFGAVWY